MFSGLVGVEQWKFRKNSMYTHLMGEEAEAADHQHHLLKTIERVSN